MPNWLTNSIIPQSVQDAADKWAQPGVNTSPAVAALKGFGAGALQGVRNIATPLGIAGAAMPELAEPIAGLAAGAEAAAPAIQGLASAGEAMGTSAAGANDLLNPSSLGMMDKMYQQASPVFQGMEEAGSFAGPRTTSNIGLARPAVRTAADTLGEVDPSFTSVGGEDMYNAGKTNLKQAVDPVQAAYQQLLAKGGR